MKRILTVIMVLIMVCSAMNITAFAETTEGTFNAKNTALFDYTTSDWMSSSTNRAGLTFFLYMDFVLDTGREVSGEIMSKPSYVLRDGGVLLVVVPHEDGYVLIEYSTLKSKDTKYAVTTNTSSYEIKAALREMDATFYENDIEEMYDVLEMMAVVLNK